MTSENQATPEAPTTASYTAPHDRTRLSGSLGVPGIVFMVVAASSPLTVVAGAVPVALGIGNGVGVPSAYVIVTVVLLLFSVGYALMSRSITNAGAFYAYITRGLSRPLGLGAAFGALLTYTTIQAAVYGLFGATFSGLVTQWGGPDLPWWVYAAAALAVVGVLGYRNVDLSMRVCGVLMLCEVGIITVLDVAVLAQGGASGITGVSFTPEAFFTASPGIGLMFAIASFVGFEATAIYSEESRKPRRTIPLATYAAVLLIGGFYAFSSWTLVLAYGPGAVAGAARSNSSGLTFAATDQYVGAIAVDVMNVLFLTSMFAVVMAFHNAVARYVFSLGRGGVFANVFGRAHHRHHSPHLGSLAQTGSAIVILAVFAGVGLEPVREIFSWMSGVATLGFLALMTLTCVAVLVFFRRTRTDTRVWHTLIAPVLGLVGLAFVLALVVRNFPTLIGGSVALATGFGLFVVAVFVFGVALALWWRYRRPHRYAALGDFLD